MHEYREIKTEVWDIVFQFICFTTKLLNGFWLNSVLQLGKAGSAPGDGKLNFTFIAILFYASFILSPEFCRRSTSNMRVWLSHGSSSRNPSIWTTALKHSPRRSTLVRTRSTIAQNVKSTSLRARSCKFGGCLQFLWVLDLLCAFLRQDCTKH